MFRDEVDFDIPNPGFPLKFARHYDSAFDLDEQGEPQTTADLGLGVGWKHTYSDYLVFEANGDKTWVTSEGFKYTFTFVPSGSSYTVPDQLHGTFSAVPGGYEFVRKDGAKHLFDSAGRLARLEDRHGNGLQIVRNALKSQRISEVQDLHDPTRRLNFYYSDDPGILPQAGTDETHITVVSDSSNRRRWYSYKTIDSRLYLAWAHSPFGGATKRISTQYDYFMPDGANGDVLLGLMKSITEPNGGVRSYAYYPNRRVMETTDPEGHMQHFTYDFLRNTTVFTDERGAVTTYRHDPDDGLLIRQTYSDRSREEYTWDQFLMTSRTDAAGYLETYQFSADGMGNLERVDSPDGMVTTFAYEPTYSNIVTTTVNPGTSDQQVTQFEYDEKGNLIASTDAVGNVTTMTYDAKGQMVTRTLPKGNQVAERDLVALFAFEENGLDTSVRGGGHSATPQVAAWVDGQSGFRTALELTDNTTFRIDDQVDLGATWTIAARFVTPLPTVEDFLILTRDEGAVDYQVRVEKDEFGNLQLGVLDKQLGVERFWPSGYTLNQINTGPETWHHIAAVGEGSGELSETRFYIDGTYVGTSDYKSETDVRWIGGSSAGIRHFSNKLDDVRIYSRALEPAEVAALAAMDSDFTTSFTYDASGQVLELGRVDDDHVQSHQYNSRGNEISLTDETGRQVTYEYDLLGRRVKERLPDPDGSAGPLTELVTEYSYDPLGHLESVVDPLGRQTTQVWDLKGNLIRVVRPDGTFEAYEYDGAGNRVSARDPLGHVTRLVYDARNRLIQTVHPDGANERSQLDGEGRLTAAIDELGRVSRFAYDPAGRLLSTTDPLGEQAVNTYDAFGNLTTSTDRLGKTTTFKYDKLGLATETRSPEELVTTRDYDANGNLVKETRYDLTGITLDPNDDPRLVVPPIPQRSTTFVYDALDRLTETVDPAGNSIETFYDAAGRVTARVDEAGRQTIFVHDGAGRLVEERLRTLPLGQGADDYFVTRYTLDAAGNRVLLTDPLGYETSYGYDSLNRQTSMTDAEGGVWQTLFDATGQVVGTLDALGRAVARAYDARGRLIREILPDPDGTGAADAPVHQFTYNAVGNVIAETDALGRTTTYEYDDLDRLVKETGPSPFGDSDYTRTGNWQDNGVGTSSYNNDREYLNSTGNATWTFDDLPDGSYQVFATWQSNPNRSQQAPYTIFDGASFRDSDQVNQQVAPASDAMVESQKFKKIGNPVNITSGKLVVTLTNAASGYVVADAIRIERTDGSVPLVRIIDDRDPAQPVTIFTYDEEGNRLTEVDPLGRTTTWTYDDLGRLETETLPDPDGTAGSLLSPTRTYAYDGWGNLESITDQIGRKTVYEYDEVGRRISERALDQFGVEWARTEFGYDAVGNRTSVTRYLEDDEVVDAYLYDVRNLLVKETRDAPTVDADEDTLITDYTYDAVGNLEMVRSLTDARDITTRYQYDGLGRRTHEIRDEGGADQAVTVFAFDVVGNLIAVTDAEGGVTSYEYDRLDRLVEERLPDPDGQGSSTGKLTTFTYDALGNLLTESVAGVVAETSTYGYDGLDRRVSVTAANGDGTHFDYDLVGNLLSLTDGQRSTTIFRYDNLDRLTKETITTSVSPYYDTRTTVYDNAENRSSVTDRMGRVRQFVHDPLGRVTLETWVGTSPQKTFTFNYDKLGRLIHSDDGQTFYDYTYDHHDRVLSQLADLPGSTPDVEFSFDYDDRSGGSTRTETIGGVVTSTIAYNVDRLGRFTQITQSGDGTTDKRVDVLYDGVGNPLSLSRYLELPTGADPVATTTWDYDDAYRLEGLSHTAGTAELADYTYLRSSNGRILSFVYNLFDPNEESFSFSYDLSGQIEEAIWDTGQIGPPTPDVYTYDSNGNRTGSGYITGRYNRPQDDGAFTYQYDDEGSLTKRTNKTSGAYSDYTWDHRNRLTQVVDKNASNQQQQKIIYGYDPNDLRISKSVYNGSNQLQWTEYYVYDERGELALVLDGSGAVTHRFLHGPAVDQILADEDVSSGDVLWPLADHQGTIRDVAHDDGATTSIASHVDLDAFGNIDPASDPPHRFAFTGREWDADAGLYYYRARWYDPVSGRFLSEDPIGFDAEDANLYRYVANDPVNRTDPSGLRQALPTEAIAKPLQLAFGIDAQDLARSQLQGALGRLATTSPRTAFRDSAAELIFRDPAYFQTGVAQEVLGAWSADEARVAQNDALRRAFGRVVADESRRRAFAQSAAADAALYAAGRSIALETAKTSLIPGYGEYQDVSVLVGPGSAWWERGLAVASLGASIFTLGTSPNFGGYVRAAERAAGAAADATSAVRAADRLVEGRRAIDTGSSVVADLTQVPKDSGQRALFGQRRVGPTFGVEGRPTHLAGRPISGVAADLRAGRLSPDDLPIDAFEFNGQLVSANTRSLAALSEAGLRPTKINRIQPTRQLLRRLQETPIIPHAALPGPRVPVTPSRSDLRVLHVIQIPGG